MDRKLFVGLIFLVFLFITVPYLGCGGGGDDVVEDEPGGVGIGADGVTVFWRYYTGQNFGAGSWAEETSDGGFIMVGNRGPEIETQDVYLFKTDHEGTLEWEQPYSTSGWDGAKVVRLTADGGYIIAGYNDRPAGDEDFLLIKTDASGVQSWMSTLDNGYIQEGQSVWPAADGGYLFLGNSYVDHPGSGYDWDACLYSVDNGGIWATTVGCFASTDVWELAYAMEEAGDGGYIIAGAKGVIGFSIWLVKTASDGHLEWEKTYGEGTAYAVRAVDDDGDGETDDGFIIAGKDNNPFTTDPAKALVIRTDAAGTEVWRKYFGGSGYDCANGIAVAGTSGVVIAGQTDSFSDFVMLYLIKLNMDGEVLWQKVKGDAENYDMANSVREVSDGGFILAAGYGDMLVKTDKNGDTVDLGERDVTMTIPSVTGIIAIRNGTLSTKAETTIEITIRAMKVARRLPPVIV